MISIKNYPLPLFNKSAVFSPNLRSSYEWKHSQVCRIFVVSCRLKAKHIEIETQYDDDDDDDDDDCYDDDDDDDDDDDESLITVGCCGLLQSSTLSTHL